MDGSSKWSRADGKCRNIGARDIASKTPVAYNAPLRRSLFKNQRSAVSQNSKSTNSLERALELLDILGRDTGGLTNAQISRMLGIATSSSSYILSRLEKEGYVARSAETGRYEIGLKVLVIARGALRRMKFRKVATPILQKLSTDTGLDGVIGVLDQDRLMVINRISGSELSDADVDTGTEFPAHATALGKVLLAHRPEETTLSLIQNKGLTGFTAKTIVSASDFLAELNAVRKQGYAIADEEQRLGLRSLGAPIVDSEGLVRAAVAAVGTAKHEIWSDLPYVETQVKTAAREISRLVRFR
jgi:IclR family acetate operon transcriptional repressor